MKEFPLLTDLSCRPLSPGLSFNSFLPGLPAPTLPSAARLCPLRWKLCEARSWGFFFPTSVCTPHSRVQNSA